MIGSKTDQAAFAEDLAVLAAQLNDDGTRIPDAYKYAYMAEFDEAIKWSQRRSPMAALLHTDTEQFHPAAKACFELSKSLIRILRV